MKSKLYTKLSGILSSQIFKSFFSLLLVQSLTYVVPFLTIPLLIRAFGLDLYGEYVFLYSFISYFLLLINYGFDISGIRSVANCNDDRLLLSKVISRIIISKLYIFSFISLLFLIIFNFFSPTNSYNFLIFIILLGVLGQVLTPSWFFIGIGKAKYLIMSNLLSQTINLILIIILIDNQSDFNYIFLINSFGLVFIGGMQLLILYVKYKIKFKKTDFKDIICEIKAGFPFFASTVGIHIYKNNAIQFLKYNNLLIDLGIFSVIRKLIEALNSFNSILSQSFFSKSFADHQNKRGEINPFIIKLFWLTLCITPLISALVFVCSPQIVIFVTGTFNKDIIYGLKLMSITLVIIGLNVPCSHYLISLKKESYITWTFFSGLLLDLICLLIFVPLYGYKGVIYSILITESHITILLFILSLNTLKYERSLREIS